MSPPSGTILCFMCQGRMFVKDRTRFNQHMNNEHGVIFELDFLFACCTLGVHQRELIKNMVEDEMKTTSEAPDFRIESVREKLGKIIPEITKKSVQHHQSSPNIPRHCSTDDLEDEIEFVTVVTADDKKKNEQVTEDPKLHQEKQKPEDEDASTKKRKHEEEDIVKDSDSSVTASTKKKTKTGNSSTKTLTSESLSEIVTVAKENFEDEIVEKVKSGKESSALFEPDEVHDEVLLEESTDLEIDASKLVEEIENTLNEDVSKEVASEADSNVVEKKMALRSTPRSKVSSGGSTSSKKRGSSKKSGKEQCNICFNTFLNIKGLQIHKSKAHKDVVNSPSSVKNCKVDLKPIKSSEHGFELEESTAVADITEDVIATISTTVEDDQVTRKLFADNISSDNTDDNELEIVDAVIKKSCEEDSKMKVMYLIENSKYFKIHNTMLMAATKEEEETFIKPIKFLPGWKMKKNVIQKPNGESASFTNFLTPAPDNIVLKSGVAVLEYLRCRGEKLELLKTMVEKMKLKEKNWVSYKDNYLTC